MKVKGLKITDILNIDLDTFNKLNESDLRHITSRLVSASNKRIRRLEKHNINSSALQGLGKEKVFSTKLPKNISKQQRVNQLRAEYSRARSFLNSETSTIGGYNKFVKRTRKRIAKELNVSEKTLKKLDIKKLFDLLHKAQEKGLVSSYRKSEGSMQARSIISDILIDKPNMTEEEILNELEKKITQKYEEDQIEDETEENPFDE